MIFIDIRYVTKIANIYENTNKYYFGTTRTVECVTPDTYHVLHLGPENFVLYLKKKSFICDFF